MKNFLAAAFTAALVVLVGGAVAATRTVSAKQFDDVAGLPNVSGNYVRLPNGDVKLRACFVVRQLDGGILRIEEPCADCEGPLNAATVQACRAAVLANPDNGL